MSEVNRLAIYATFAAVSGCALVPHRGTSGTVNDRRLNDREKVAHVLSRLTFGARAGDAERVSAMGVDRWLDEQLRPESIADSATDRALAPITVWSEPVSKAGVPPGLPASYMSMSIADVKKDTTMFALLKRNTSQIVISLQLDDYFYAGKIIRAQTSERQLLEVITDFWENHFSVFDGKMPSRTAIVALDRQVLRPNALGKFRDLLGAVAHSPAMLYYLDNQLSNSRGLNENYARELLELHTLGVDGGYTQKDVQEVARALTGWTIRRFPDSTTFQFVATSHDQGEKVVLGHTLRAGRGMADGEEVLDILARHSSTAHFIALKLARRLVSDVPPAALVDRAAATFQKTDGDIREVVRTIVTSPEFYSRASFRAKVRTPFELTMSARRALDAPVDSTTTTARAVGLLGQRLFGWSTPEGYPDRADAWINSGTMYKRIAFASDMATGRIATAPTQRWREFSRLSTSPANDQIDGVVNYLLGGIAAPSTRNAMVSAAAADSTDGTRRLRSLIAVALASPEFQHR
jgi:uncharacterized protein (DUF1800 family)